MENKNNIEILENKNNVSEVINENLEDFIEFDEETINRESLAFAAMRKKAKNQQKKDSEELDQQEK